MLAPEEKLTNLPNSEHGTAFLTWLKEMANKKLVQPDFESLQEVRVKN